MNKKDCNCSSKNHSKNKVFYTEKQKAIIDRIKKVTLNKDTKYNTRNKLFI